MLPLPPNPHRAQKGAQGLQGMASVGNLRFSVNHMTPEQQHPPFLAHSATGWAEGTNTLPQGQLPRGVEGLEL